MCVWLIVMKKHFFDHNKVFFDNFHINFASEMLSLLYVAHFVEKKTFLTKKIFFCQFPQNWQKTSLLGQKSIFLIKMSHIQ